VKLLLAETKNKARRYFTIQGDGYYKFLILFERIIDYIDQSNRDVYNLEGLFIELWGNGKNIELLVYCVNEIINKRIINKDEYEIYLKEIQSLDASYLSTNSWKEMSFTANAFGLLSMGYAFRKKAIESAFLENKKSDINKISSEITAAIDIGNPQIIKRTINKYYRMRMAPLLTCNIRKQHALINIYLGNISKANKLLKRYFNKDDIWFANYINNKSIAIVGSAPSELLQGNEIDSFDIVVRLNTFFEEGKENKKIVGSKTNIIYMGKQLTIDMARSKQLGSCINDVEIAVISNLSVLDKSDVRIANRVRQFFLDRNIFFMGFPNMVQRALFDLLLFKPKRIKIFNTNFYLSSNVYREKVSYTVNDSEFLLAFALHDSYAQLNVVRNLFNKGIVEVDNDCRYVCCLSNEEYASRMEQLYSLSDMKDFHRSNWGNTLKREVRLC